MSFKVRIDSNEFSVRVKWINHLERTADMMFDSAADAAEKERTTKTYRNRTGNAIGSTGFEGGAFGDDVEVVLHADAEYASILARRGFSSFEEIAEETIREITAKLNREP